MRRVMKPSYSSLPGGGVQDPESTPKANHKMDNNSRVNLAAVNCWMFIIIIPPTNATYTTAKEEKEPVIHKRDKPIQAAPKQTDTQPNPS